MTAGDGIVIHNENAHLARMDFHVFFVVFPVRIGQSDIDGECGSFSLLALHLDGAVHHLHDILRDGHAQAGASVPACVASVLLGEGVKDMGHKIRAHADTGIGDGKAEGRFPVKLRFPLHLEVDMPALRRELHGVAQNVDQHLAKLHIVADIIIIHLAADMALVIQALVLALAAEHGIDGFQELPEGEFLILQGHSSRLDPGHIQNVVDEIQEVFRRRPDLLQIAPGLLGGLRVIQGDVVQADDGIHRRPNLMAHAGQEGRLCLIGLLGRHQGIA